MFVLFTLVLVIIFQDRIANDSSFYVYNTHFLMYFRNFIVNVIFKASKEKSLFLWTLSQSSYFSALLSMW
jgi:hypothetical protein